MYNTVDPQADAGQGRRTAALGRSCAKGQAFGKGPLNELLKKGSQGIRLPVPVPLEEGALLSQQVGLHGADICGGDINGQRPTAAAAKTQQNRPPSLAGGKAADLLHQAQVKEPLHLAGDGCLGEPKALGQICPGDGILLYNGF